MQFPDQAEVERALRELEVARANSERLWAEHRAYAESVGVASPEGLRTLQEGSYWTGKLYEAEHALFMAEHGTPGVVGSQGRYQWLSMYDCDISELLGLCPQVVLGKVLAVASIDGTTLKLTDEEKTEGWWTSESAKVFSATSWGGPDYRGGTVAYSPLITSIHRLPNETRQECCGFHEWLLFEQPVTPGETEVFVNWMGLRLYDATYQEWIDRLFEQLENLSAESYIADGTVLTFATRNSALFQSVIQAFSAKP